MVTPKRIIPGIDPHWLLRVYSLFIGYSKATNRIIPRIDPHWLLRVYSLVTGYSKQDHPWDQSSQVIQGLLIAHWLLQIGSFLRSILIGYSGFTHCSWTSQCLTPGLNLLYSGFKCTELHSPHALHPSATPALHTHYSIFTRALLQHYTAHDMLTTWVYTRFTPGLNMLQHGCTLTPGLQRLYSTLHALYSMSHQGYTLNYSRLYCSFIYTSLQAYIYVTPCLHACYSEVTHVLLHGYRCATPWLQACYSVVTDVLLCSYTCVTPWLHTLLRDYMLHHGYRCVTP